MKGKGRRTILEAVALTYSGEGGGAPVVTALGRGLVAEKMLERAKEHNIPVVSDPVLSYALGQMDVGEEIPREFYEIVAQILVTVSRMDSEYGKGIL